ncbi:MAG TPA: DUF1552 domain-containing protein, partial [Polyangiaceae bacterium]|nr:DUF1552 domain-containing protein [Polyangiaceae bacterium]
MKRHHNPLNMNRRMMLRSAGGLMLGLPLLDVFMPRKLAAQETVRSPFVLIVVSDNGVVQAGVDLGGNGEPEMFWPTASGTLTSESLTADKATRSIGELADHAEKILIVRGVNLPFSSTGCSHSAADAQVLTAASITAGSTNAVATGISIDTVIAAKKNVPGRDPLVLHSGMFSPGGTGFDIPGYVSYVSAKQPRVYVDSPYDAYQMIIGAVGDGTMGTDLELEAEQLRADRSKSINDILRPQIQALLSRTDLSQSDRNRLDQHLTAIRDIEVQMMSTQVTVADMDVQAMQDIDPKPYDQSFREQAIRLNMKMMAFST